MEKPDLTNKCYRTKDDHRHATIWGTNSIHQETAEEREERLRNLRKSRGTWVYDPVKREVVRKEDYINDSKDVDSPIVSKWDPEWALIATGKRMSKSELKRYCRERGKVWEN